MDPVKPGEARAERARGFTPGYIFMPGATDHSKHVIETLEGKAEPMQIPPKDLKVEYGDWVPTLVRPTGQHVMVVATEYTGNTCDPALVRAPIYLAPPAKLSRVTRLALVPVGSAVRYTDFEGNAVTAVRVRADRWANFTMDPDWVGEASQSSFDDDGLVEDMGENDFELFGEF